MSCHLHAEAKLQMLQQEKLHTKTAAFRWRALAAPCCRVSWGGQVWVLHPKPSSTEPEAPDSKGCARLQFCPKHRAATALCHRQSGGRWTRLWSLSARPAGSEGSAMLFPPRGFGVGTVLCPFTDQQSAGTCSSPLQQTPAHSFNPLKLFPVPSSTVPEAEAFKKPVLKKLINSP